MVEEGPEEDREDPAALVGQETETEAVTAGNIGKLARKAATGAAEEAPEVVDQEVATQAVEAARADGLVAQVGAILTLTTPLAGLASSCTD